MAKSAEGGGGEEEGGEGEGEGEEEEETYARESDANLMRASPPHACGAPTAAHQSLARRKMYVHFKCGTQIFNFS